LSSVTTGVSRKDEIALGVFFGKSFVHLDPIWNIRENGRIEARFKHFQIG
jgi:hypothetical protein